MAETSQLEELVRRLAAAVRAAALYAPGHPLLRRGVESLAQLCQAAHHTCDSIIVGFIGDDVVINGQRLARSGASLAGFAREFREREIEKITIGRGVTRDELLAFVLELADRKSPLPLTARLDQKAVRRITIGRINLEQDDQASAGIAAARKVYGTAVETAETLWQTAKAGEMPDPNSARKIIDSLAKMVSQDRTSLMALTAVKRYDNYTFTHMVNVSVIAMAQARALNLEGPLLREFGFAALMHDIGKVNTPLEVLNKPDKLTREEFDVMKQHVVDGAHILRRTPEMPALAPVVAFEHHLRQDLSGYPENVGHRELNLCTQIVSIADVYDALRSNRVYRQGLPSDRIKAIMTQKDSPAFNGGLLRRFINLMGIFPVGTMVRLDTGEMGVVTHEHPSDPFRPQVKILKDEQGNAVEEPKLINTWETDSRGEFRYAVVEAVDPESVAVDPLEHL
jgi:putative nucleotidyltransferase with HDIG domain